jgi:hypothetical protein
VAYWLVNQQRAKADELLAQEVWQQLAKIGFHVAYFEKELAAREWLLQKQAE